ncbi:MAG: transglycosylase domain-containing protein [Betaproteobacteria bacterium]
MRIVLRLLSVLLLALLALQLYFAGRIVLMRWIDPESTSFERAEAHRLVQSTGQLMWRQEWVPYDKIAESLKRAVIASEDATFTEHDGVDLEALEKAWEKNQKAEQEAARRAEQARRKAGRPDTAAKTPPPAPAPKIIGGSTITQQLAKNLFLSGERTLPRKAQELVLTFMLEASLSKRRILEIYLNSVEWGEGVFGAEAAAQHYYRKSAARLTNYEAARLAVMLPRPRYFEKRASSGYLAERAQVITVRMNRVDLP